MSVQETSPTWVGAGRYVGQRALVTGGAGGLGFATACRLAAEGAIVAVADLEQDAADAAAAAIRAGGHDAFGYAVDVRSEASVAQVFASFAREAGPLDVLATFAGNDPRVPLDDMDLDAWRRVTSVHLDGTYVTAHAALKAMAARGYGRILTVSSGTVYTGWPDLSAYVAAKMGVLGLTRVLARHGGPLGVTANAVMPGLIATDASGASAGDDRDRLFASEVAQQCVPRLGRPDDIAETAAWLCSRGAGFVTGQVVYVSGGRDFIP